jgi:arginyl-tRNA--protein-N-Asp/Glu arginylyltransferase
MLVQYHTPQFLSPTKLDRFLAGGWFRNCHLLFRSKLLCIEREIFCIVNIRLPLKEYTYPKRMRKIYNRGNAKFRYEIGNLSLDAEKERLFEEHKHRFKGFLFDSLEQFFSEDLMGQQIFDTKEIRIYDGDKLVAYSFFDEGKFSLASLLGVFDADYSKYSLGTYSMLLEIEYAIDKAKKFYYPGYVLDKPSVFDYKLKLGKMDYYDWRMARWENDFAITMKENPANFIQQKLDEMADLLKVAKVPYRQMLYPIFSLGYLSGFEDFVKSPAFLLIGNMDNPQFSTIIEYNMEEGIYTFSKVEAHKEMGELAEMRVTEDFSDSKLYEIKPLSYLKTLGRAENPQELISKSISKLNLKN